MAYYRVQMVPTAARQLTRAGQTVTKQCWAPVGIHHAASQYITFRSATGERWALMWADHDTLDQADGQGRIVKIGENLAIAPPAALFRSAAGARLSVRMGSSGPIDLSVSWFRER